MSTPTGEAYVARRAPANYAAIKPADLENYIDGLVNKLDKYKKNNPIARTRLVDAIAEAAEKIGKTTQYSESSKLYEAVNEIKDKLQGWTRFFPANYEHSVGIPQTCYTKDIIGAAGILRCGLLTKLSFKLGKLQMTGISSVREGDLYHCSILLSLPGVLYGLKEMKKDAEEKQGGARLIMLSLEAIVAGITTFKRI